MKSADVREYAVRQALETLRNRIDQFGVSEPTLQRQEGNRILIQLPGVKDPQRAIDLLGKTARLEFKMVMEDANPQDAVAGKLPPGGQLLYERRVDPRTGATSEIPIVVEDKTIMTGDLLSDAQVRIDNRFNDSYVAIDFNAVGAKRFDQITAANVGKRMAIVLDDTVYSAPVIRERISGGSAQISGSFTEQEATDLAIILRAGSLPAPVEILENRTVGPSLGPGFDQPGHPFCTDRRSAGYAGHVDLLQAVRTGGQYCSGPELDLHHGHVVDSRCNPDPTRDCWYCSDYRYGGRCQCPDL